MLIKKIHTYLLLALTMLITVNNKIAAQITQSPEILAYIESYSTLAIEEMIRTGVPASIKIAQGIIETKAGKSELVIRSNNHFGIKCKSNWSGEKVFHDDDERGECFRKYSTARDSYVDHSDFLKSQPRYSFLFNYDKNDYAAWAWGLKQAGYATNPAYAQTLIKYIEQYNLNYLNRFAVIPEQDALDSLLIAIKASNNQQLKSVSTVKQDNENKVAIKENRNTSEENEDPSEKKEKYPTGVFKVNESKVIYGKKGTSLLAIAKKYKLQLSNLLYWNELPKNTTVLSEDQLIFIQKKRKTGTGEYHVVKVNEDLKYISQKEGIQLSSLLKLNKLKSGMQPKPGEKLSLQSQRKQFPKLTKKHPIHIVKKGESLYTISKKYDISIDSIKEANAIKSNELHVGQKLKILK